MSIIRNDRQLALNDLVVAIKELADHYQDSADFLDDEATSSHLEKFAKQHLLLTTRLERAIRAEDDLPSVPDLDRETGSFLFEHISASLSADETIEVVEQRMQEEIELGELIEKAKDAGLGDTHEKLLIDLEENNRLILHSLRNLLKHHTDS